MAMTKWQGYTYGTWINGKTWESLGYVYIDVTKVIAVENRESPRSGGCTIMLEKDINYTVQEIAEDVVVALNTKLWGQEN